MRLPKAVKTRLVLRDRLVIKLKKNGKVLSRREVKGKTWTSTGKNLVRDAMADGGFTAIGYMNCNGTGGTSQATTNSKPSDFISRHIATWPTSGAITGITEFRLRQTSGGSNLATVTVTSFDKPDGIELEVTWEVTVSSS